MCAMQPSNGLEHTKDVIIDNKKWSYDSIYSSEKVNNN